MSGWKLYKVYHLGAQSCWDLRIAKSAEEALTQCFEHNANQRPATATVSSCRVEEVKVPGFRIIIEKIEE